MTLQQSYLTSMLLKRIDVTIFLMNGMIIAGLLDSVIRNRSNVKIFFIMNAVQDVEYSPLFTFFNLQLPYNNDIKLFKNNLVLLQYMSNEEFREQRKETLIGQLMERYSL